MAHFCSRYTAHAVAVSSFFAWERKHSARQAGRVDLYFPLLMLRVRFFVTLYLNQRRFDKSVKEAFFLSRVDKRRFDKLRGGVGLIYEQEFAKVFKANVTKHVSWSLAD